MRLEDNVFSKIKITKNLFYFLFLLGFRVGKSIKTESRVVVVRGCGGGGELRASGVSGFRKKECGDTRW